MNRRPLNGSNLCNHKQKVFGTNAHCHMDINKSFNFAEIEQRPSSGRET